ncbi:hypothetical protein [Nostoc sp. 'Peltigera membranacea cyanobiont' N6]|uniref:hypothetical protein n=1 Tax=Nostoc sp. 'Peltigera membranacea cyanobiont' N6 TaxID=1261031 RepID=UPI000D0C70E9|nr:hypothetical protein [Nostoc sp. 'Peltigera membranacea cyanobiont' N6]AVH66183.1 hypothetical protein NPM_4666 [Nostoc sp. 'Peltigera membranacea cyanobiont' N6]
MSLQQELAVWGRLPEQNIKNYLYFLYICPMPEKKRRKFGKTELYQRNMQSLVKALLWLANDSSQSEASVQVEWVSDHQMKVTGEYKKRTETGEKVFKGTTKLALWQLVEKTGNHLEIPSRQREGFSINLIKRQAEVVQNALYYLEDLRILKDERPENLKNKPYWIFTLTLKHKNASVEENLSVIQQKLDWEMSSPVMPPSSSLSRFQSLIAEKIEGFVGREYVFK